MKKYQRPTIEVYSIKVSMLLSSSNDDGEHRKERKRRKRRKERERRERERRERENRERYHYLYGEHP